MSLIIRRFGCVILTSWAQISRLIWNHERIRVYIKPLGWQGRECGRYLSVRLQTDSNLLAIYIVQHLDQLCFRHCHPMEWPETIPRVQCISETGIEIIPSRYIRPDDERLPKLRLLAEEIPIIDLAGLYDERRNNTMEDISDAGQYFNYYIHSPVKIRRLSYFFLRADMGKRNLQKCGTQLPCELEKGTNVDRGFL